MCALGAWVRGHAASPSAWAAPNPLHHWHPAATQSDPGVKGKYLTQDLGKSINSLIWKTSLIWAEEKKRVGGKQEEETSLPKYENESIPVPVQMHGYQQMRRLCAELSLRGCICTCKSCCTPKRWGLHQQPGGQKGSAGTHPWFSSPQTCTLRWLTLTLPGCCTWTWNKAPEQRGARNRLVIPIWLEVCH